MFEFFKEFVKKIKNYFNAFMENRRQQEEEHNNELLKFYDVTDGYASLADILEDEEEEV